MNAQMAQQAMGQCYQQGLLGGLQNLPGQWHDCTCVPGRSALLQGDLP
jgi:hypothetical protein